MTEQEMEDLIATFPDDFFPDKGFRLKGRQQSFAGVGRFDLLFEDRFSNNILMELKAAPPKYDVVHQLGKYRDELKLRGESKIWMWLVAPVIPMHVREFLDNFGIEYREIHLAEFRRVTEQHGVQIRSESEEERSPLEEASTGSSLKIEHRLTLPQARIETGPVVTKPSIFKWRAYGYDLLLTNPKALDRPHFMALVDAFERSVRSRKNATLVSDLKRWAANPDLSHWSNKSNQSLLRWVTTSGFRDAVPHAWNLWTHLFGGPAPTWYVWRTQSRSYEFDHQAWRVWYESLDGRPATVKAKS